MRCAFSPRKVKAEFFDSLNVLRERLASAKRSPPLAGPLHAWVGRVTLIVSPHLLEAE
jgi:hypothetical protein